VRAALFDHFVGAGPLLLAPDCKLSRGLRRQQMWAATSYCVLCGA
jgi:hypothetical protein